MRAVVYNGGVVVRGDYPEPRAGDSEAVVQVHLAGICRTDLEITHGYLGFRGVMGHEFVGTVASGPPAWLGKRVVAEINCVCGECDMCTTGLRNHCRRRTVVGIQGRDGVFADRVSLPLRNLHEVPAGLRDDEAVFVEPLAAALQLARQIRFDAGQKVVVLGDGRLGQLVARVLRGRCPSLVLVGRHAEKLQLAERLHIQTALAGEFSPRHLADIVVDATGSPSGFELALRTVRPRGTLALKSTFAEAAPINLSPVVVDEITIVGSRCGPFGEALAALAKGEVEVTDLISRRLPLERAAEGLELAGRGAMKVLLDVA